MIRMLAVLTLLFVAAAPAAAQSAPSSTTFFEFQVESPATVRRPMSPVYPPTLLRSRVEGEVIVQFVVNTQGEPEMDTFRVIRSTNAEFTVAVRAAVQGTRFTPAKKDGAAVRQVVQQPYAFSVR